MSTQHRSEPRGFTLVELMIVVAIIAVLASVAGVAYSKWVDEARKTEAKQFLGSIRGKEEGYRARYGTFVPAAANPTSTPTGSEKLPWDDTLNDWKQLGARPGSPAVSYSYQVVSGTSAAACAPPGDAPNACAGTAGSATWFFAVARNSEVTMVINSARDSPWEE